MSPLLEGWENVNRAQEQERGAAAVELALILPLVVALLFGSLDFGMALNDYQTLRAGVRDGLRDAAVADYHPNCAGYGTSGQQLICSVKEAMSIDTTEVRVRVEVPMTAEVGEKVVVCAATPMESISGVFAPMMSGRVLKAQTVMRVEVASAPLLTTTSEPPVEGSNWDWCTP